MGNGYSFIHMHHLPKIVLNSVVKLLMFLKIDYKWALYDGKGNLNVEMSMHNQIFNVDQNW